MCRRLTRYYLRLSRPLITFSLLIFASKFPFHCLSGLVFLSPCRFSVTDANRAVPVLFLRILHLIVHFVDALSSIPWFCSIAQIWWVNTTGESWFESISSNLFHVWIVSKGFWIHGRVSDLVRRASMSSCIIMIDNWVTFESKDVFKWMIALFCVVYQVIEWYWFMWVLDI